MRGDLVALARLGKIGGFDQPVGDAAHRGNDRDDRALPRRSLHDLRHARDARGIAHRRPAEFHYSQWLFHVLGGSGAKQFEVA